MQRVHFIAIGGSVMHNLALCLHRLGFDVSGSDDIIYDPAYSRLEHAGILPSSEGWNPDVITEDIDEVILGMHAKSDNVELIKAQELSITISSFPEFVAKMSFDKKRVVVAGSHGKTTTTSMIMHGLKENAADFDFLVGAQLKGFDLMVQLSHAPLTIIEGDEYLSSALDSRPKFLHYNPHICLLTGLDWDHVNVFPTYKKYLDSFRTLIESMTPESYLVYNQYDTEVINFVKSLNTKCKLISYLEGNWVWAEDAWKIEAMGYDFLLKLTGNHNVVNAMGAFSVLLLLGYNMADIIAPFQSFSLPDKRLNLEFSSDQLTIYRDFAHAPSKVRASVESMNTYIGLKKFIVIVELHTYSSLNKSFLPLYKDSLESADEAFVYYNPRNLEVKKLEAIDEDTIMEAFNAPDLHVLTDTKELRDAVKNSLTGQDFILLMSSSNFGGIDWLYLT